MARSDIRVRKQDADTIRVGVPFNHIDLTEEEAGELAQQLLSKLGCSFEIKWPDLQPSDEQRIKNRQAALASRRVKAEEYADMAFARGWGEARRAELVEAYIAGHDASPKPLNHPYR